MLKIRIHARSLKLTRVERAAAERRLVRELARFGDRIGTVTLKVSRIAAKLGKFERHCHVEVSMTPKRIRVQQSDPDWLVALSSAAQRAARNVSRLIASENWPAA
jgi:ribosome-associated translation inhibitor RaiA